VQQQYGLAAPGTPNVFTWRQRPDVRAVADLMRSYLSAWDYRLVRVKLLPLLLEWDVRQGPGAGGVQLRPVDIKKAVPAPGAAAGGAGDRGWCYLVKLDRVAEDREVLAAGAAPGSSSGQSLSAAAGGTPVSNSSQSRTGLVLQGGVRWRQPLQLPPGTTQDQEDWVIDCAWLAGQGKGWAAPPGLAAVLAPTSSMGGGGATQGGLTQGSLFGEEGEGEEGEGEEGRGPRLLSGTCKPEHRYLRCSLLEGVWPDLVAAWRDRWGTAEGHGRWRVLAAELQDGQGRGRMTMTVCRVREGSAKGVLWVQAAHASQRIRWCAPWWACCQSTTACTPFLCTASALPAHTTALTPVATPEKALLCLLWSCCDAQGGRQAVGCHREGQGRRHSWRRQHQEGAAATAGQFEGLLCHCQGTKGVGLLAGWKSRNMPLDRSVCSPCWPASSSTLPGAAHAVCDAPHTAATSPNHH
jgi:hypothetical protein